MKKLFIILLFQFLLLFFPLVSTHAACSLNLPFGTPLQDVEDDLVWFRQDPSYGGIGLYQRKDDHVNAYEYGTIPLLTVVYGFWHDKLCEEIFYFSKENGDKVYVSLVGKIGFPTNVMPDAPVGGMWAYWKTYDTYVMLYSYNPKTGSTELDFYSIPIMEEQQGYR